tara:strand:- start:4993 stop:6174 length:1182 start_codon:yes stop_codon:yes gene_type:complete
MEKLIQKFKIPNKKIETWKFTDLKKNFEKNNFKPLKKINSKNSEINISNNIFFDSNSNFVIFHNGYLNKINNATNDFELKKSKEIQGKNKDEKKIFKRSDNLLDINESFLNEKIEIKVKKNTKIKDPIFIFYYNTENKQKYLINNRVDIILEENSEAEINEIFFSDKNSCYWNNVHNFITLGKNAKLDHYKIQLESYKALHSSSANINCHNASIYNNFIYSVGGDMSRIEVISSINSSDVDFNIKGLYLAKTNQHHDITTLMQHKHPESKSNQHIKGILHKNSSGVFQGKVIVSKDAQKTDAFQFNQNLLLSEKAEVNAKPELEIYADDVKCSHGATTGELDEEMLFYLRSRGLNYKEAKKILVEGFINELFENIKNTELKKKLFLTSKKEVY